MKYLLDVNALVALGFLQHEFHSRTAGWVRGLVGRRNLELATCSITELGFLRVLSQAAPCQLSIAQAKALLLQLKQSPVLRFTFVEDDHDVSRLPSWVKTPKRITDGHLQALANEKGFQLATLDEKISGAFLIPERA